RYRLLPDHAGVVGYGLVEQRPFTSVQAAAQRWHAQAREGKDQGQEALLTVELVLEAQPVALPCGVMQCNRAVAEDVEERPGSTVAAIGLALVERFGVVQRQATVGSKQAHECR